MRVRVCGRWNLLVLALGSIALGACGESATAPKRHVAQVGQSRKDEDCDLDEQSGYYYLVCHDDPDPPYDPGPPPDDDPGNPMPPPCDVDCGSTGGGNDPGVADTADWRCGPQHCPPETVTPFSGPQRSAIQTALSHVKTSDPDCQTLVNFLQNFVQAGQGGQFLYDPNDKDNDGHNYHSARGNPSTPDYGTTITITNAFNKPLIELERTLVHEASHAVWWTGDDPTGATRSSAYYWENRCVQ